MDPIDNINNYRYGIFYYNKNDLRTVVPKRSRIFGYTFNFAVWKSWAFLTATVIIIAAGAFYFGDK